MGGELRVPLTVEEEVLRDEEEWAVGGLAGEGGGGVVSSWCGGI